jgi:hypothetical protein
VCVVKTPKIKNTGTTDQSKPLPILRNPILDGMGIEPSIQSLRIGRGGLVNPLAAPGSGGGGGSGGSSSGGGAQNSGAYPTYSPSVGIRSSSGAARSFRNPYEREA